MPACLLRLDEVQAGYGETAILDDISLTLGGGERIGLLGYNGAGKSTLIRLLAGEAVMLGGERIAARELRVGYFAQHQLEQLDGEASALLHLQRLNRRASEQELRNFLGGFAFHGDRATSPVAPFSGGEKARLVLAMIVYQRPNLLLLDEPTNHLDLEMRHALTTALQDFDGAMVVVSHDRHLLRTVADRLYLVEKGRVSPFDGDVDDYRQRVREQGKGEVRSGGGESSGAGGDLKGSGKKQQRQQAAEQRRRLQPLRKQVKKLETELGRLNDQRQALHEQLSDSSLYEEQNREQLKTLLAQQADIDRQLEAVEEAWLKAGEELEQMDG